MKNLIELSIFLPNEPGMLAKLLMEISENNINLKAISVVETADYGLILLLVDKPEICINFLQENKYEFASTEILPIKYGGDPSILFDIAKVLGESNVNIEYLYLTVIDNSPFIILRVDNLIKGEKILKKKNLIFLKENET